jgi:integrase
MFAKWITEYGHTLRSGKDIKWQIPLIIEVMSGETPIKDITNKTVHGFVQGAKDLGKSGTIINRCLTRLRATMLYAGKKWDAPISAKIDWPAHFQPEPKEREVYLSPEDARAMMDKLPYHVALAMAFSLYTGMRLNELETLDWSMIDFDRGLTKVNTKGGGTRGVWLSKKAIGILNAIGIKSAGQVFDLTNRRKHWEAARRTMGRTDLHWHDLRAMTATWARKYAGRDLRLIGQALGHSDTKVTERYARVVDREIATMMDDLPDLGMPKLTMQTSADLMQTSLANTDGRRS